MSSAMMVLATNVFSGRDWADFLDSMKGFSAFRRLDVFIGEAWGGRMPYFKNAKEYLRPNHTFKASGEPGNSTERGKPIIQKFILRGLFVMLLFALGNSATDVFFRVESFASDAEISLKIKSIPGF